MRKVMEAGLEMGRGIRRWENYVNLIWMPTIAADNRRPTSRAGRKSAAKRA